MSSALYMSHFPNFSLEGDQDHGPTLTLSTDPSLLYPFVIDNPRDQGAGVGNLRDRTEVLYPFLVSNTHEQGRVLDRDHDKKEINKHIFMAGSSSTSAASAPAIHGIMADNYKTDQKTSSDQLTASQDLPQGQVQGQWMPSNIKFMRKMMNSDRMIEKKPRKNSIQANQQDQTTSNSNNINPSNGIVRVCSACNTTKTPLWRTGPCGPKVAPQNDSVRSERIDFRYHLDLCKNVFGEGVYPEVDMTNIYYGGTRIGGSRIIFTNGSQDPWRHASKQTSSETMPSYLVKCHNCGHGTDLRGCPQDPFNIEGNASNCTSPEAVKKVRQQIIDTMDFWLSECKSAATEGDKSGWLHAGQTLVYSA